MSAAFTPSAVPASAAAPTGTFTSPYANNKVNFWHMIRSEWIKRWSLKSTWWVVIMSIVLMAGLALLIAFVMDSVLRDPATAAAMSGAGTEGGGSGGGGPMMGGFGGMFNGAVFITIGYQFAMLTVAVLGVLAISSEYTSGMIRATLSATPRRLRVLWSKLIVLVVTTVIIGVVGVGLSWLVTYPILSNHSDVGGVSMMVDWTDSGQLRQIGGAILFLVIVAVMAMGIGAIMRATAGGIFTNVAILWVLPMILGIIVQLGNVEWLNNIYKLLPSEAGAQIIWPQSQPGMLGQWEGVAVMAGFAVALYAVAAVLIKKRDA
jgi:ABC-2 type transport system permease protein